MSATALFFLFTLSPVFTKTYLLWLFPSYSIGLYEYLLSYKNKYGNGNRIYVLYFLLLLFFWGFYGYYLKIWDTNFAFSEDGINF